MGFTCPNCNGPAIDGIFKLYCKAECDIKPEAEQIIKKTAYCYGIIGAGVVINVYEFEIPDYMNGGHCVRWGSKWSNNRILDQVEVFYVSGYTLRKVGDPAGYGVGSINHLPLILLEAPLVKEIKIHHDTKQVEIYYK